MKSFAEFLAEAKRVIKPKKDKKVEKDDGQSYAKVYEKKRKALVKRSIESARSKDAERQQKIDDEDRIMKVRADGKEEGRREVIDKVRKDHGIEVD